MGYADELGWTEKQWESLCEAAILEARRARVCATFLPACAVEKDAIAVPTYAQGIGVVTAPPGAEWTSSPVSGDARLTTNSDPTLLLAKYSMPVYLRSHEAADPELNAALGMVRTAANLIARAEDAMIFCGQPGRGVVPTYAPKDFMTSGKVSDGGNLANPAPNFRADGLLPFGVPGPYSGWSGALGGRIEVDINAQTPVNFGDKLVSAVSDAVSQLEATGHFGPFWCILSPSLFVTASTPAAAGLSSLPRDQFAPLVEGRILRSGLIPEDLQNGRQYGLVVSSDGRLPVEIVRSKDMHVHYLQTSIEPRRVFNVSERFALRLRDPGAVAVLYTP